MKLFKSWVYRIVGVIIFGCGFLCAVDFAFDLYALPSLFLAFVLIPVGGILFVHGLMVADEPPES